MSEKIELHPRNRHRFRYDFPSLIKSVPELRIFVKKNTLGEDSIDFSNPSAVRMLNKAILKEFYGITWTIPENNLCPGIPGRADYIHYIADLLNFPNTKNPIRVLDIGTGANCIYPIIGHREYNWHFLGTDIEDSSLQSANSLIEANELSSFIELRKQNSPANIFKGVVLKSDHFDVSICNPPFHASKEEARQESKRKLKNLKIKSSALNFSGTSSELWCPGGEVGFITRMIEESVLFQDNIQYFSCLVAKAEHLPAIYTVLKNHHVPLIQTIPMAQGQKKSRIIVWSFKTT